MSISSVKTGEVGTSLLAGNPADVSDFESISTVSVTSAVTEINFTSIPSTYTHLQIRGTWSRASTNQYAYLRFNGDTANNYAWHDIYGAGTPAYEVTTSTNAIAFAYSSSGTAFTGFVWDILDYANTNKYKTARGLEGRDTNGDGAIALHSGLWQSTNAITSITIFATSNQIAQYSHFSLYGIRTA